MLELDLLLQKQVVDPAAYLARMAQLRGASRAAHDYALPLRSGRVLALDVIPVASPGPGGQLLCVRDETLREQARAQLVDMADMPNQNPNPILRLAATGQRLFANVAAQELAARLTPAEFLDVEARLGPLVREALRTNAPQQAELATRDQHFEVIVKAVPALAYANVYLLDITSRYQAAQQVVQQRTFYEALLDALPVEVVVLDEQQRYVYFNTKAVPAAEHRAGLAGHTLAELAARYGLPLQEQITRQAGYFQLAQTAENEPKTWEVTVPDAAGEPCYLLRSFRRLPTAAGARPLTLGYGIDVTARHRAEAQVAEQRAFYESVLNELPSQIAVYGPDQRYRYLNARSIADPATRQQWLGKSLLETAGLLGRTAEVAASRHRRMVRAVEERRPVQWEETYTEPDGQVHHYLRYYHPVFGPAGRLEFVIGYNTDITGRVRAEAQLHEQQQFMQLVLDTVPSAIFAFNRSGQSTFSNQKAQQIDAVTRTAEGRPVNTAEVRRFLAGNAQVLATGQELTTETVVTSLAGEARWFQSVRRPLPRPDGTTHVLGVSTDITALKQAQRTLEQSEKQYRDLMHYAQALICTYNLHGTIRSINPAMAEILGAPVATMIGQPLVGYIQPTTRAAFAAYLGHIAEDGEAEGVFKIRKGGTGEIRHLLYRNFVMREPGQEPYIISHSHDITGRVLAEQEMSRAREEAEATVRVRENFLANMSHEIRTPMNGVLGMTARLAKTPLDAQQQQLVQILRSSGRHLLTVLDDVLEMAKLTAGKLELAQAVFNLHESVVEALLPLAAQAQEKDLTFEQVFLPGAEASPWVVGDPHRLNQVLLNLVSNAVKFTARGRIVVQAALLSDTPELATVGFSVRDTGPGIAADKQALIFESFTQAQADTSRHYGGTGLGLSISRSLVDQMGGTLTLVSQPGQGSTFSFTLAFRKAPTADIPTTETLVPAYDTGRLAGVRVLLVEDNQTNRTVARLMLEAWGVQLEEAANGWAALARLQTAPPYDVVLMDIQMPGMSGVDVTQRLRQLPEARRAATPVIALTANAFQADIARYLAAGFSDYLAKPYEEAALYRKIEGQLRPLPLAPPVYDLTHLRRLAKGKEKAVAGIIQEFLADMPPTVVALRAAAAAHDWAQVARLAHHIKPTLLSLGITQATAAVTLLAQLDATGPVAASAATRQALDYLLATLAQVLHALPAELP